ncbi:phosphoribosylglycinamide formyltransferase 1 [Ranunculus cassubicifolius]
MEAHTFLPRVSLNPVLKTPAKSPILSSFQHIKWKSFHSVARLSIQRLGCRSTLECRSNADKLENVGEYFVKGVRRKKIAVFVSGGGSNFKSLHEASVGGLIHGDIAALVTNKPDCGGAEYARFYGIPVLSFPKTSSVPRGLSPMDLVTALRKLKVDFIVLAGYLKLLPVELIQAYPKSILNIHPSLLPAFGGAGYYGMKVHRAVIASGARYSGPTVHFVDEHYDTGRILAQSVVPVFVYDSAEELAARVLHEVNILYVEVVSALCEDRIVWREDGVPLIQKKDN